MKNLLTVLLFSIAMLGANAQCTLTNLLTENLVDPIGIDQTKPRFNWQLQNSGRNIKQVAYEMEVRKGSVNGPKVWQSGKVMSDSSVHVAYKGAALQSGTRYWWKVRVWDNGSKVSAWSSTAFFQTALLQQADWKANWVEAGYKEDSILRPCPLFRKSFSLKKKVQSAVAYITAHGMYEAQLNGRRVGNAYLTPGWTAYHKRLQYQTYDVTGLVQKGENAVGVTVGNGWYRGPIGFSNSRDVYGKTLALLMQIVVTYSDGNTETITTDSTWKSTAGPIRNVEIYNGEMYDARLEKTGWANAGFDDKDWSGVKVVGATKEILLATHNEPVTKHEVFQPVKVFTTPAGEQVIDFGQNLVGWVTIKVNGQAGDTITLRHAEILDKKGNMYFANLRQAKQTNHYILKGGGTENFEPHFSWQGFRYVQVKGLREPLLPENFQAVALYSNMQPTGTFSTSNTLLNQLQHNIQWGQRGNFLDVPTDCPQRDERLGWTGDAQAFSRTASFNMNVDNFFAKWLQDLEADQVNGAVPYVIPNVIDSNAVNSAGWADVATIIPWNMYLAYADRALLANQYNSMKAYVESIRKVARDNLWNNGSHFGDWLFYRPEDDNDGRSAVTDKHMIAQCFYAHSTQLLINAAKVLGKKADEEMYAQLLEQIKAAFQREYLTPSGRLVSSTQTAYVLALQFDMLPDALRTQAAKRLNDNVKAYGNHITTGFLGTPYICHVLTRYGYDTTAYKLLLQEKYPSWLYPVKMGATTIWERWDGQKPDSSFQTPGMNSFNHYAYGAIGDWMYRQMVGLDTYEDEPGYKHIRIQPHLSDSIKQASASLKTYYGEVSAGWKLQGQQFSLDVTVPPNTHASVFIPALNANAITESGNSLNAVADLKVKGMVNGYTEVEIGSGTYHFAAPAVKTN